MAPTDSEDLPLRHIQLALLQEVVHHLRQVRATLDARHPATAGTVVGDLQGLFAHLDRLVAAETTAQQTDIQLLGDAVTVSLQKVIRGALVIFVGFLVGCAGLLGIVRRSIVRPVLALAGAARTLADKGAPPVLAVTNHDEIGLLQGTFNEMVANLRTQQAALEERIAAERRALDALRESERQLRAVFDTSLDGMGILDDRAQYLDANAALCAIYGLSRADLLTHRVGDFVDAPNAATLAQVWPAFLATGHMRGEFQQVAPDGTPRAFEYAGVAHFLPGRHVIALRDISERQAAEAALRTREERYRRLVDISPDAILLTDLRGQILLANRRAADLFGTAPAAALLGQNAARYVAPASLPWAPSSASASPPGRRCEMRNTPCCGPMARP